MIPSKNKEVETFVGFKDYPTNTYKLNDVKDIIVDKCDMVEALKQAIVKILNTERYKYSIYSWNYGVEFLDLIGKPIPYAMSMAKVRIKEALTQDDRIFDVDAFYFTLGKNEIHISFTVHTIYGEIQTERLVEV